MADDLTASEKVLVEQFLKELTDLGVANNVDWTMAVKFLMARKFDLKRAIDLFKAHQVVRLRECGGMTVHHSDDLERELKTEKLTVLASRDLGGASIALFTARNHLPAETRHDLVLRCLVYQLDTALLSSETQRNGLIFLYDMTDSKMSNFDYDLSIKILNMLKGAYPARLKKVLIITAPLWFKAPFKILRLFVKEKLRDRVHTVGWSQLPSHIPKDSLPISLGGSLKTNHRKWIGLCYDNATNQPTDVNSYFVSRGLKTSNNRDTSVSSVSSETDTNLLASDFESECSRDTVQEKYNHEAREKETRNHDDVSAEKEVAVEKQNSVNTYMTYGARTDTDSRKRPSEHVDSIPGGPPILPRKKPTITEECPDSIHNTDSTGMALEELVYHVKSLGQTGLFTEYALVRQQAPAGTFNTSKAKTNLPCNRYTDVLCYDHSRVLLDCTGSGNATDYINANYVDGYKQKNAYISTQGPLPRTFDDFWQMVWQERSRVIVMTTKSVERGRTKCGQYWPNEEDMWEQYGNYVVHNCGIDDNTDYIETSLTLKNSKTGESRDLVHLQFTSWPDYGIPDSAEAFLEFLLRVRECQRVAVSEVNMIHTWHKPPIIVHCSAGIGRTGTFITIDISLHRLHEVASVDIHETVTRIRGQRAFSIQMPDQYVFCHLAVIEFAQANGLIDAVDLTAINDDDDDDESD